VFIIPTLELNFILPAIPIINKWNKVNKSIFPKINCTAIVTFNGKLDSTLGLPKITEFIRDLTYLNTISLGLIVGLILGDAYLKKGINSTNVRIGFKQSIINFPFMWATYIGLAHYCNSLPRFEWAYLKSTGLRYGQLVLETRSYPVMNILYTLFIEDGKKIIREELYFYLSPIALAYWIMSYGVSQQYGLLICTDNFSVPDVVRLINILKIRYDLNCSIHYTKNKPRIYIKADSMNKLRILVGPHIIPFSNYKLRKGKRNVNIYYISFLKLGN
jgi:hypothetical protein